MDDSILKDQLQQIVQLSQAVIAKMSKELVIRFDLQSVEQKEIEGFVYNNDGASYERSSRSFKQIKNWTKACFDVYYAVAPSNQFLALDKVVKEKYPEPHQTNIVSQYAFKLFYILFKSENAEQEKAIDGLNTVFLQQLNGNPHFTKGTAYLNGIILEQDIQIADGCLLRRTVKNDLEQPQNSVNEGRHLPVPSAVLEIELQLTGKQHGLIQEKIVLMVQLLRLFDVGSINYNHYEMQFDIITGAHMSAGSMHGFLHPWKKYHLKGGDEARFIHFVNHLIKEKDLLNSSKSVNHINIAFDRYSEALLENVSIERRIANAVMGLEALLSDPSPEIKFKLSLRISKLLAFFGFAPLIVKSFVSKAYDIRSSFAHGGHLSINDKNKLEANFQGADTFTTTILSYLRVCIVINIATGIKKKDLMLAIDDSLLDIQASQKLANRLEPANQFLIK